MGWEIGSVESGKSVALPTLSSLGIGRKSYIRRISVWDSAGSRSASYCDIAIRRQYSVPAIFEEPSA